MKLMVPAGCLRGACSLCGSGLPGGKQLLTGPHLLDPHL